MKRIGKTCFTACLFCFLFLLQVSALGQPSVSVEATVSNNVIYTGERLKLDITISGDFSEISRPSLPEFTDFQLLNNTPSTSRSISYTNGVTRSSYTYSYYLSPNGAGNFTLPSISITVDGQNYQTEPIDIEVTNRQQTANEDSGQPDIFLRLNVSDSRPVTGEQVIANVVLYFKDGLEVRSYQPIPGWKAEGFWKEELESNARPQVESTILNGVRYRTADLLQFALFPTKSGELTISPYQIRAAVRSASRNDDPFGSFFGSFGSNQREMDLKSDPVTITVEALPEDKDSTYIGAVGSFNIDREISTQEVVTGQSIEITTTISGTGNIPLINKPTYDFPDGMEVYEPQEQTRINRRNQQISGSKTYTDVVLARTPGQFTLPEAKLAYYNPSRSEFVVEILPARTISVEPNPDAENGINQPQSFSLQPITGLASWVSPTSKSLSDYWWFWFGLILPGLALALGYWRKSYQDKMKTDHNFARSQQAAQKAQERLDEAMQHSQEGDISEAYNKLQKAITGFIGDRLGLPEAGLSIEQYVSALQEHNVNEDLVKNVRMLLNKCATINYAPDTSESYVKSHVGLAESIIEKLKKEL